MEMIWCSEKEQSLPLFVEDFGRYGRIFLQKRQVNLIIVFRFNFLIAREIIPSPLLYSLYLEHCFWNSPSFFDRDQVDARCIVMLLRVKYSRIIGGDIGEWYRNKTFQSKLCY